VLKTGWTENMKPLQVQSRFAIYKYEEINMSVSFQHCAIYLFRTLFHISVSHLFFLIISVTTTDHFEILRHV